MSATNDEPASTLTVALRTGLIGTAAGGDSRLIDQGAEPPAPWSAQPEGSSANKRWRRRWPARDREDAGSYARDRYPSLRASL